MKETRSYSPGRECRLVRGRKGKTSCLRDSPKFRHSSSPFLVARIPPILAWATHEALGNRRSIHYSSLPELLPRTIAPIVEEFVRQRSLRHEFIETHEMENPSYPRETPPTGVTSAKTSCFSALDELAHARGFAAVAYGVNRR